MYSIFKRLFDLIMAIIFMIILSPLFLFLILMIKIDSPGPVFFKQKRIGINKTYFYILKFRTMKIDTPKDIPTHLLKDPDKYITKVGSFLRKVSLDELPQIWNIICGHMSFVGPRPALWNQSDLVSERDKYSANSIRPGLTGWAQINGRDELPIDTKARLDGEYLKRFGLRIDVECLIKTVFNVLKHDGVVEGGTGALSKVKTEKYDHNETTDGEIINL